MSPSAIATPPSGLMLLKVRLRAGKKKAGVEFQRALTQKRTLSGGGALEVGDLRLLENGSERGGALVSDPIGPKTARDGWDGDGERVGMS